jgi:mannose-6-phosphate isomerase-like protein (cupin superfamily)
MNVIHQSEANVFPNSAECIALEYPFGDPDINAVVIKLSGRYPETGFALNEKCKEMAYVIEGEGTFVTEKETVTLMAGDTVFIPAGEKYYWEGTMSMFVPCTPAWNPEQHKIVENA